MSITFTSPPSTLTVDSALERAILSTLAYSDIFDHPLTLEELHKFLLISSTKEEIAICISSMPHVKFKDGFYFLADRPEIVDIRQAREANSRKALRRATRYGRIIGSLPFIRLVALTGSLAMLNLSKHRDMDFLLVAKPGHIWTARAFVLVFGRLARLFGDVICPNVIISENALKWQEKNLYSAREFAQMIPISGLDVFAQLQNANPWVQEILPNHSAYAILSEAKNSYAGNTVQTFLEWLLTNKLTARFESWEMTRKIARFKNQKGYGVETNFSADVCQGNFDHHGTWTMKMHQERLRTIQGVS